MTACSSRALVAAAVLVTFTAATVAAGQAPRSFTWWRSEPIVKELGLTTDQVEEIESVFRSMRQEARQELRELEALEEVLSSLIQSDADEGAVVRQIDKVETARASLSKTRSLMLLRFRRVLTPDQRTLLTEIQERRSRDEQRQSQSPRR